MRVFFTAVWPLLVPCLSFACLSLALTAAGIVVRRRYEGGLRLPPAIAAGSGSVCLLAMLVAAWWFGLREAMPAPERPLELINRFVADQRGRQERINSSSLLSGGGGEEVPLEPNAVAPRLEAAGWLNGPPPAADEMSSKLVVVDAFDDFCPMCRLGAPVMVAAYERFGDRVTFISLTTNAEPTAREFAEVTGIRWPIGYEAKSAVHGLGAGAPTVFLVSRDGRILWNDNRTRYRHNIEELQGTLEDAIERALADQQNAAHAEREPS